jgi:hypothetical protein
MHYLLLRIRREAFERVGVKVLTNVRKEFFGDILWYHPSDDRNTGASDSFNALCRYSTSFDVRKVQLRDHLLQLVHGFVSVPREGITYGLSLGGDFFSPDLQSLNEVIPRLLDLLFKPGGQVTLQVTEPFRQWRAFSARESREY